MLYIILLSVVFLFGVAYVALSFTPAVASGVLVMTAGIGCGITAVVGSFFLALVLFLVYLGGMLVVFAFSAGMSVDLYFKHKGGMADVAFFVGYFVVFCAVAGYSVLVGDGYWQVEFESVGEAALGFDSGFGGVCELYSFGGCYIFVAGWVLLLTLFVVLELVRGVSFGALKGVV